MAGDLVTGLLDQGCLNCCEARSYGTAGSSALIRFQNQWQSTAASHFCDFQLEERPALGAHQPEFGKVNRSGFTARAGHRRIGGFGQRIGRNGARPQLSGGFGHWFKSAAAVAAHMIETAIRSAGVKHLTGAAFGAGQLQLARSHVTW